MGQEIFYCSKCQVRLRTSDFDSAKAFRIQDRVCCASCAQEVIRTLPPDSAKKFLQGLATAAAKDSPDQLTESSRARIELPPPTSTPRMPMRIPEQPNSSPALVIGIAAGIGVVLIIIVAALMSSSDHPPAPRPAPLAAAPIEIPAPPPKVVEPPKPLVPAPRPVEEPLKPNEFKPTPSPTVPPEPAPKPPEPAPAPAPAPTPAPAPEPVARPPAPAPEPTKPRRPPVPDAATLRASESAARKTFSIDQAKTPKDKGDLARTILNATAGSAPGDPDFYARLRAARDLAAAAADPRTALLAIDTMAGAFEVDAAEEKVLLLTKATVRAPDASVWARACLEAARQMSAGDEHEAAGKVAARAESLAVAAKDLPLRDEARERIKEYTECRREWDRIKPSLATLKSAPDDPAACTAIGRYLCLFKEDWDKGLPLLAKGTDGPLKSLAEQEVAKPADAAAQAAIGEGWAVQSEKELQTPKARAKAHAVDWLERSLPGLSGPAKTAAEKRLSQLGSLLGSKTPPVLELGGGVRVDLIYCKAGSFMMGTSDGPSEPWLQDARPLHKVELTRSFFLGKFEVTRGQFTAFVKATGYVTDGEKMGLSWGRQPTGQWGENPGVSWKKMYFPQTDDDPVLAMSWNDAKAFCDWVSAITKRKVRLPTEAEWEYACRAGSGGGWWFGDPSKMAEYGWNREVSNDYTSKPVGQKKPNPWGFYDMYGNAWEWCLDWAGTYKGADARDPEGSPADTRAVRGGCYESAISGCQSWTRLAVGLGTPMIPAGFRVLVR